MTNKKFKGEVLNKLSLLSYQVNMLLDLVGVLSKNDKVKNFIKEAKKKEDK